MIDLKRDTANMERPLAALHYWLAVFDFPALHTYNNEIMALQKYYKYRHELKGSELE